jgi:hypothetical protein
MQYSASGSGAYMYACAGALTGVFGYASAKYNYPPNLLQPINSNLEAGYPVLLGIDSSGASGHAIVCDGFGYSSGTMYHHLNMGWAGSWDLWYTLPGIGGAYNFNSVHCVIFNVFPTGTGELIAGRVTTPQDVPVQGASVTATSGAQSFAGTTDAKGYYGIKVPASRTYVVAASQYGMSTATRSNVVVTASSPSTCGNAADVDLALSPFAFTAMGLTQSVWLRWTAPTNCGLPNNTVYVRWRTDRYPTTPSDGAEVYSGTDQLFIHTGRDNSGSVTNYYAIWGNDGTPHATISGTTQADACADRGPVKLFWTHPASTRTVVWLMKADGTRRVSGLVGEVASGWTLAGTGDIDRDGVNDQIWFNAALGRVNCWFLNADGTKRSGGYIADVAANWRLAAVGDIDADGTADLIWHNALLGKVNFWLLNPDGSKRSGGPVADAAVGWIIAGAGDLDCDGTLDLIWHNPALGKANFWLLNPNGTKRIGGAIADAAVGWTIAGMGDIDGDRTPDLIWHNASLGKANFWLLNTNGTKRSGGPIADAAPGWTLAGAGDLNADGTVDLIWHNAASGQVNHWLLNANGTKRSGGVSSTVSTGWSLSGCVRN